MARSLLRDGTAASIGTTLSAYRFGVGDRTIRLTADECWRATITPQGPATLHLRWDDGAVDAQAWGPGADWLLARVPAFIGEQDPGHVFTDAHPLILATQRRHPHLRLGASSTLYHDLLPMILGQRITAGEALNQWRRLIDELGEPAPGPNDALRLPPTPTALLGRPGWWFHRLGIEGKRADALRTVAKYADRIGEWSTLGPFEAGRRLAMLSGIGVWTIGSVLGPVFGDPDAVAVGDFHLKNLVGFALAGEARATDERMLELLAPYAAQRGRAVRLIQLSGTSPPKFGPRQRVLPMHRW